MHHLVQYVQQDKMSDSVWHSALEIYLSIYWALLEDLLKSLIFSNRAVMYSLMEQSCILEHAYKYH